MKKIYIEEIKHVQNDILKFFVSYCNRAGLKYYLAYGTLIGAVRHKGYIPWDDDIDVIMPRPDYESFVKGFRDERYKVFCIENNPNCPFPYAKLFDDWTIIKELTDIKYSIGLNIDIFVLDGLPSDLSQARTHIKRCSLWLNVIDIKKISINKNRYWIRNVILFLMKLFVAPIPLKICVKRLVKLNKKYSFESHHFCSDLSYTGALHLNKLIFGNGVEGTFEGENYTIPSGFDSWLKSVYGNYMLLPPKEKRITHHAYEAWWK